jgi:hypothetical protein
VSHPSDIGPPPEHIRALLVKFFGAKPTVTPASKGSYRLPRAG